MADIIRAELYNLKRSRGYKWLLAVDAALCVLLIVSLLLQHRVVYSGKLLFENGFRDFLFIIICAVFAGLSIGADFSSRTINRHIASGYERVSVLAGKTAVYFIAAVPLFSIYPIISGIAGSLIWSWGEPLTASSIAHIALVFIMSATLNLGICGFFVFCSFLLQDAGKSIACSIVGHLVLSTMLRMIGRAVPWFGKITNLLPISLIEQVGELSASGKGIFLALASGAVSALFFVLAAYAVYRKAELK
ncbi:MAG: ABC transporter permease subunit [Clostridiales bacterium]|nr:ABC transporter permease subunit [Clostridiales bacterium]